MDVEMSSTVLIRETDDGLLVRKVVDLQGRKTVDADKGIEEVWISTEAIDRDGDIVEAAGGDLTNYLRNPVVLFGHNYWSAETVVARTLKLEPQKRKGIRAQFQFAPDGVSRGADTVRGLWQSGLLNAASIGFMVSGWNWIDADGNDLDKDEDTDHMGRPAGAVGRRFSDWELLEWSIVPVPANQEALRAAVGKMAPLGAMWLENALKAPDKVESVSEESYEAALTAMFDERPDDAHPGEQISGKAQYQDASGEWHDIELPPPINGKDGEVDDLEISEGNESLPDADAITEGEEAELSAAFATLGEAVGHLTDHFAQRS